MTVRLRWLHYMPCTDPSAENSWCGDTAVSDSSTESMESPRTGSCLDSMTFAGCVVQQLLIDVQRSLRVLMRVGRVSIRKTTIQTLVATVPGLPTQLQHCVYSPVKQTKNLSRSLKEPSSTCVAPAWSRNSWVSLSLTESSKATQSLPRSFARIKQSWFDAGIQSPVLSLICSSQLSVSRVRRWLNVTGLPITLSSSSTLLCSACQSRPGMT